MGKDNITNVHPVDLYVGQRLKQKRLEKGVSQYDLANSVSITFQQVQKYEKGINRVSSSKLYDFAKFLEVDIRYFFEGLNDYKVPSQEQSYALDKATSNFSTAAKTKEMQSLVNAFRAISNPNIRRNIILLIRSLQYHLRCKE